MEKQAVNKRLLGAAVPVGALRSKKKEWEWVSFPIWLISPFFAKR